MRGSPFLWAQGDARRGERNRLWRRGDGTNLAKGDSERKF